jgi:hypothetical protein
MTIPCVYLGYALIAAAWCVHDNTRVIPFAAPSTAAGDSERGGGSGQDV